MKSWISTRVVGGAIVIVAALVLNTCWIAGMPEGGPVATGIAAGSGNDAGPFILAQYNPCPNRKCR